MPNDTDGILIPVVATFSGTGLEQGSAGTLKLAGDFQTAAAAGKAAGAPIKPEIKLSGGEEVQSKLNELTHEAEHFLDAIKTGLAINVGERLNESLGELQAKFKEAVSTGVEYNVEVENSVNSMASTLQSVQPEIYRTRDAALAAAKEVFSSVRDFSIQHGPEVHSTFEALSANYQAFVEAGAIDVKKQIEFISTVISAEASKGISGSRALIDSIDLLTGRVGKITFAKEIGVTEEGFKAAAAAGQQLDYIMGHLTGYKAGIASFGDSFTGLLTSVKELTHQAEGEVFQPVFSEIKLALVDLKEELQKPEVVDGLKAIGYEVADIVHSGASLLEFCVKNTGPLMALSQAAGVAGVAFTAMKVSGLVQGLFSLAAVAAPAVGAVSGVAGAAEGATLAMGGLASVSAGPVVLGVAAAAAIILKLIADMNSATAKAGEMGEPSTKPAPRTASSWAMLSIHNGTKRAKKHCRLRSTRTGTTRSRSCRTGQIAGPHRSPIATGSRPSSTARPRSGRPVTWLTPRRPTARVEPPPTPGG